MRGRMLAGSVSGILAALTAAVAFTAIKFIPKTEPTIVLAMWFHTSALAMSIVPLAVRPRPCPSGRGMHGRSVAGCRLMASPCCAPGIQRC
jgi:drug/metabolite transporter (DMT)-like permease